VGPLLTGREGVWKGKGGWVREMYGREGEEGKERREGRE